MRARILSMDDWKHLAARRRAVTGTTAAVLAVALMSSYVHVLHRAVADGPARQEAAFAAGALHDSESDRDGRGGLSTVSESVPVPAGADERTRNRLNEPFEPARPRVVAGST
jgi:hypothetical protein